MKIRPVGSQLFHTYRQTDITELIFAFRKFLDAPTNRTVAFVTNVFAVAVIGMVIAS